jgi:hypothetical protein
MLLANYVRLAPVVAAALVLGCGSDTTASHAPDASLEAAAPMPISLCGVEADSGGGPCAADASTLFGLTCCSGTTVNLENDPLNCGSCGHRCEAGEMCLGGCRAPSCASPCNSCQTCCAVNTAGPARPPSCFDGPTCPVGCPGCT